MKHAIKVETDIFVAEPGRILTLARQLFNEAEARRNAYIGLAAQLRPGDEVFCLDQRCPLRLMLLRIHSRSRYEASGRHVTLAHNPSPRKIRHLISRLHGRSRLIVVVNQDALNQIDMITVSRAALIVHDNQTQSNICIYEADKAEGEPIELDLDGLDDARLILHASSTDKSLTI